MKNLLIIFLLFWGLTGCSTALKSLSIPDGSNKVPIMSYQAQQQIHQEINQQEQQETNYVSYLADIDENNTASSKSILKAYFIKGSAEINSNDTDTEILINQSKGAEKILITGYVGGKLGFNKNDQLARKRAEIVKEILINAGIDSEKIKTDIASSNNLLGEEKYRADIEIEKALSKEKLTNVFTLATIKEIAEATKLDFSLGRYDEEVVMIEPSSDPIEVIKQIAKKSNYGFEINKVMGSINIVDRTEGLASVIYDDQSLIIEGEPIVYENPPKYLVELTEAMKFIVPNDWNLGFEQDLSRKIKVDLSKTKSWREALESLVKQTPYKYIWSWNDKTLYAVSIAKNISNILNKGK